MQYPTLEEYTRIFIQRIPHYIVESKNGWRTKHKPLSDRPVRAHLEGAYSVGVLSKYYPGYALLDLDGKPIEYVEEIRAELGMQENNSMLYTSKTPDHYHLIFRPQYNSEPPSSRQLKYVFKGYAQHRLIEVYPQENRCIRLPFGPIQRCLDEGREHLTAWEDKLYWFTKLDEIDLSTIPRHNLILPFDPPTTAGSGWLPSYQEGIEYLDHGLVAPSTRDHAQFCIAVYLWRQNVPPDTAREIIWKWLCAKNHGFSKQFKTNPQHCKKHIAHQVQAVYGKFDTRWLLPDTTHNVHRGYITKPDIERIIQVTHGNMPRMQFLFELVKYSYPRRFRPAINIPSKLMRKWASSHSVGTYLRELQGKSIIDRGRSYTVGFQTKSLTINWPFESSGLAIAYEGRAVDGFRDAIRLVYKPEEFQERIKAAGVNANTARKMKNSIFMEDECSSIISRPST